MEVIDIILTSLLGFLIVFGPYLIVQGNLDAYSGDHVRIKFSTFLSLYAIKPESWCLYSDYVAYYKPTAILGEDIYFGFLDTIRYKRWNKKRQAQLDEKKMIKKTLGLAESWQNDINEYVRNASEEIQQMKEGIGQ